MKRSLSLIFFALLAYTGFLAIDVAEGVPSNQWVLSQLGLAFNQTPGEISAGVTPTLYGYVPGNAWRYGCLSTLNQSGNDSTPCIQTTENASAAMGIQGYLPGGGLYYLKTRLNWVNGACLIGDVGSVSNASIGTTLHIVTSQFAVGGPQHGNQPIQSTVPVCMDRLTFSDDQPADTGGWTPTDYGPIIQVSGSAQLSRFTNITLNGVNKWVNLHSTQGAFFENIQGQFYTYGINIDHNADFMHAAHFHVNDYACSVASCPNVTAYVQSNGVLFQSNRNDSPIFIDIQAFGIQTEFAFGTDATGVTTKFTILSGDCDKCQQTILVTGVGVNGQAYGLLGHGDNFAGNQSLSNSSIINIANTSTGDVLQISDIRCEYVGDSCITDLGSNNIIQMGGSFYAQNWGSNSTNGSCATIYALPANLTGSSNVFQGSPNDWSFSPTCSSLTFNSVTAGPLFGSTITAGGGAFTVGATGALAATTFTGSGLVSVPKITFSGASCSAIGVGFCNGGSNALEVISGSTQAALVDLHQHWNVGSTAAASISSGACGTGTNGTVSGNDHSGLITIGASATATCTVSFSSSYTTAPRSISLTPANSTAASSTTAFVSSIGTGNFVITGTLASTNWYYWVQ